MTETITLTSSAGGGELMSALVSDGSGEFRHVSVAYEADGSFLLAWDTWNLGPITITIPAPGGGTTTTVVQGVVSQTSYVQHFAGGGGALAPPVVVTYQPGATGPFGPSFNAINTISGIGINDDGAAFVAWTLGPGTATPPNTIELQAFDELLAPLSTPIPVVTSSGEIRDVDVAVEDDGTVLLAWDVWNLGPVTITVPTPGGGTTTSTQQGVVSETSYAQHLSATGAALSAPIVITSQAGSPSGPASSSFNAIGVTSSIGTNADGDVLAAWTSAPLSYVAPNTIFVQAFDPLLNAVAAPVAVVTAPSGAIRNVDVAVEADGSFLLAWDIFNLASGGNGVVGEASYVQHFSRTGSALDQPTILTSPGGSGFNPIGPISSVGANDGGATITVYTLGPTSAVPPNQIFVDQPALFTPGNDQVDFNALSPAQAAEILAGAGIYDAFDGDDVIAYPDAAAAADLGGTGVAFDLSHKFHAGDGADIFDFGTGSVVDSYPQGQTIDLDGGGSPGEATEKVGYFKAPLSYDGIALPGAPSDYTVSVTFAGSDAAPQFTTITRTVGGSNVSFKTTDIEKVSFSQPISNSVTLTAGSLYVEAAELAAEVYGIDHGKFAPAEPLAWNNPELAVAGARAVARGWHEVSAMEIGLAPADAGNLGNLQFSFADGFYQALNPLLGLQIAGQTAEDDALVLTGVVNGQKTLAVVFRGTDQIADFSDYFSFYSQAYTKYKPLVEALKTYIQVEGIGSVLSIGHSLGGGLSQIFSDDLVQSGIISNSAVSTFTFGSPGAELLFPATRQINFVHTDDLVGTVLSDATRSSTLIGSAARVAVEVAFGLPVVVAVTLAMQPKTRSGTDVRLNSDISSFPSTAEHDMGSLYGTAPAPRGYVNDIAKLARYAGEGVATPFEATPFATAMATNVVYTGTGSVPQLAIGNGSLHGGLMHTVSGDQFVLGDINADDGIIWNGSADPADPRDIDGGGSLTGAYAFGNLAPTGTPPGFGDTLVLSGFLTGNGIAWAKPTASTGQAYSLATVSGDVAATLHRIDTVMDLDGFGVAVLPHAMSLAAAGFDPTRYVVHPDGRATTFEQAAQGQTTLTVSGTTEVSYAGPGVTAVASAAPGAVIVYDADVMTINASGDRTTVISDGAAGLPGPRIDASGANDIVYGGPRDETFVGHLAGSRFEGAGGDDTIDYTALSSAITYDVAAGAVSADGLAADQVSGMERVLAPAGLASTLILGATTTGALADIGTAFQDFTSFLVGGAAQWSLGGTNVFDPGSSLSIAFGGSLDVTGSIARSPSMTLDGSAMLRISSVSDTPAIAFANGSNSLTLDAPTSGGHVLAALTGLSDLDTIVLPSISFDAGDTALYDAATGTLAVLGGGAQVVTFDQLHLADGVAADFILGPHTLQIACFAQGTRIDTPAGEVEVERLRPGDRVSTSSGTPRPVRWIGHRRIDFRRHHDPRLVQPILIRRGAIARGLPRRDLLLSPDHCLWFDGFLIPARRLVNGATIVRATDMAAVTYFHVELGSHDLLLADGVVAESYLDTSNRGIFSNADLPLDLHPDLDTGHPPAEREGASCAPFAGPERVEAVWTELEARAVALGYELPRPPVDEDPDLRILVQGRERRPIASDGGRCVFVLPRNGGSCRLLSRSAAPCDVSPWLDDQRRLGVRVRRITTGDGHTVRAIPLDHPNLVDGWWDVEREGSSSWRWTTGDAVIPLDDDATRLTVHLAGTMPYVVQPASPSATAGAGVPLQGQAPIRPRAA